MTSEKTDERTIRIDCPVCGQPARPAVVRDFRQKLFILHVIPFFAHSPTTVTCSCGASLVSSLRARDLVGVDASFAARYLSPRLSPVLKTLVLGGLVAWMLPAIGTVWLGIAYGWSRRYSGWIRNLALVLLLLSLLPTAALFLD